VGTSFTANGPGAGAGTAKVDPTGFIPFSASVDTSALATGDWSLQVVSTDVTGSDAIQTVTVSIDNADEPGRSEPAGPERLIYFSDAVIAIAITLLALELPVPGTDVHGNGDVVHFLREHLRLTGTHVGCDTSQCGACVVHLNGKATKSCTTLALQVDGAEVTTIEGLAAPDAPLHPMQEAFREHHGLQCGFCTPGMIMTAVDLVHRKGNDLSDHTIREELEGNLCRCTGYQNIVQSIAAGAKAMANSDPA
jgi:carbon-monoxide dehydrogenase small subunit